MILPSFIFYCTKIHMNAHGYVDWIQMQRQFGLMSYSMLNQGWRQHVRII